MDIHSKSNTALFQVYLRLRPAPTPNTLYPVLSPPERFLTVEEASHEGSHKQGESVRPTHVTLQPPNDNRRRAVEKFAFTRVFEETATQSDLFHGAGIISLVEGVLGSPGNEGRDGLLATLGVTGSGKSHTILGTKHQRGLTQLALDLLFRSASSNVLDPTTTPSLHGTVAASDGSEAQVLSAHTFFDMLYGESGTTRAGSRAPTPMRVRPPDLSHIPSFLSSSGFCPRIKGLSGDSDSLRIVFDDDNTRKSVLIVADHGSTDVSSTVSKKSKKINAESSCKDNSVPPPPTPHRNVPVRPSVLPSFPDIGAVSVAVDHNADYVILVSMYEVYNDRIFDLLVPASRTTTNKDFRRRPLLFKSTEQSPDSKVVAGLRKIICCTMRDALMVLEAGLTERRVAGTGSNSVSSRSHGFFCVEVKKRRRSRVPAPWISTTLTIVDLAGSERARDAKTHGATLAEAGKINESLMYLGQCLQMQSDAGSAAKPNIVPFRQCKLTELLFSNSFPSHTPITYQKMYREPQRAVMIVTADPLGDFNATSQILRYSALAREITVPRIPSITSTILASVPQRSYFGSSHGTPSESERETMEIAAMEIARMSEEIDGLRDEVLSEQERRVEAEAHLMTMQDRIMEVEAEIREECWAEMERRMQEEMRKWKEKWEEERERGEEHVDRKLELLIRGVTLDDGEDKENANTTSAVRDVKALAGEQQSPRKQFSGPLRETVERSPGKSPVKKRVLGNAKGFELDHSISDALGETETMTVAGPVMLSANKTPLKKVRKLTARKWDLLDEDELL